MDPYEKRSRADAAQDADATQFVTLESIRDERIRDEAPAGFCWQSPSVFWSPWHCWLLWPIRTADTPPRCGPKRIREEAGKAPLAS